MPVESWPDAEPRPARRPPLHLVGEWTRYFAASVLALAIDFAVFSALIRLAGVNYLAAAPVGFMLGLALHYALSTAWVFRTRKLTSVRAEFVIFSLVGVAGLLLNQLIVYAGVEHLRLAPELAKLLSAGISFCFNYALRKVLLFSAPRAPTWPAGRS